MLYEKPSVTAAASRVVAARNAWVRACGGGKSAEWVGDLAAILMLAELDAPVQMNVPSQKKLAGVARRVRGQLTMTISVRTPFGQIQHRGGRGQWWGHVCVDGKRKVFPLGYDVEEAATELGRLKTLYGTRPSPLLNRPRIKHQRFDRCA